MSMGRKGPLQESMWVPHTATRAPGHRFYEKLNELLDEHGFDRAVEGLCERFYAEPKTGRPSIPPGVYFRMLLIGYFEGIESERGICWRVADSLSLRSFLGLQLTDSVPDHSSLCRIRQRLDLSIYEEVFQHVLGIVRDSGLLRGKVVGVDSTYLKADASMKAIVRRDTQEVYRAYLKRLAEEDGIEKPTDEDARRMDRKREKKTSNAEWKSKTDEDARIARLKDGRTRLAYKPEHVADLETGAIVAAPVYRADEGDTATIERSLEKARDNIMAALRNDDDDDPPAASSGDGGGDPVEVVADKGYHKASLLLALENRGFRPYIPERKQRGRRRWKDKEPEIVRAVMNARARAKRPKAKSHHRRRGEFVERGFAHVCETGAHRRTRLRGVENVSKRYVIQAAAANLGLIMRTLHRHGTPRELAARAAAQVRMLWALAAAAATAFLHDVLDRVVQEPIGDQVSTVGPGGAPGPTMAATSTAC
jgi:transposase